MIKIAPSILSADFTKLGSEIEDICSAGAEYVHFDVMDGFFVPNISIGIPVLKSVRKMTDMFLDVHLMIDKPVRYAKAFCDAGADLVMFHVEADSYQNISDAIDIVKENGKKVGLSVKPRTPASVLYPFIERLDMVLVMTVEPGFGGQSFMHDQLPKIAELRREIDRRGLDCELEVDGGVDPVTAKLAKNAQVKEMWLTHYSPSLTRPEEYMDDVRKIFPAAKAGKDKKSVELDFEEEK